MILFVPRAATTSDPFNAVAEPRRREILEYLAAEERAVGDIATVLGLSQPSISKHLNVLRNVGLVHVRRDGRSARAVGKDRFECSRTAAGFRRDLEIHLPRRHGEQGRRYAVQR